MPPQAIFAATCHVTPLATVPDRRKTVLGRPVAVRNFLAYPCDASAPITSTSTASAG